jgi:hypothetical protein
MTSKFMCNTNSMASVVAFPNANQIAFAGGPMDSAKSQKSESLETTA